jgi:predicted alpha/beta-hydrolase family hydrolase
VWRLAREPQQPVERSVQSPTFRADDAREARISNVTIREVETAFGLGRVNVQGTAEAGTALVLGHGAGGGVQAVDLVAASEVALEMGLVVARVEQPYRVAGRRSPPRAPQLDGAWIALVEHLRANELAAVSLIVGGRSLGARVACRTSAATGAVAVLSLAFPLEPPRRSGSPPPSRLPELEAVRVPTLVVQGISDRFGIPPRAPSRRVVTVPGDHSLKADLPAVRDAIRTWLRNVVSVPGDVVSSSGPSARERE